MNTQTLPKIQFKAEWTPKDFTGIEKAIAGHFNGRTVTTNRGRHILHGFSFRLLDKLLGLAYTSSSSFALYGICNVELKYDDQYNYQFFAISGDNNYYAILWDKDENEKIIEL